MGLSDSEHHLHNVSKPSYYCCTKFKVTIITTVVVGLLKWLIYGYWIICYSCPISRPFHHHKHKSMCFHFLITKFVWLPMCIWGEQGQNSWFDQVHWHPGPRHKCDQPWWEMLELTVTRPMIGQIYGRLIFDFVASFF